MKLLILLIFTSLLTTTAAYADNRWLQPRLQFQEAHKTLQTGNVQDYLQQTLAVSLETYPILDYLRLIYTIKNIDSIDKVTIKNFLDDKVDEPFAPILRRAWLEQLAKEQDWETYAKIYERQKSTILHCHYLRALIETQQLAGVTKAIKEVWTVGKSQPKACDPAFNYLYENNLLTEEERWQRIRLSMLNGKLGLARYVSRGLPNNSSYHRWLQLWQRMYQSPQKYLKSFDEPDEEKSREIILQGLRRLAANNVDKTYLYWQLYQKKYHFSQKQQQTFLRDLALEAADKQHSKTLTWFNQLPTGLINEYIQHRFLQVALIDKNWQAIIDFFERQPSLQKELKWQYWQAKALENTGNSSKTKELLKEIAKKRHYYGFLAAEELNRPYQFRNVSLKVAPEEKQKLQKNPRILRARELFFVGLPHYARLEWQLAIEDLKQSELKAATALAHEWGWHRQAISTAYQAGLHDILNIRFPTPYYDNITSEAIAKNLDPAWIYAAIRQESAFDEKAKSSAGALGLMQLMPATARGIANKIGVSLPNDDAVLTPEINIKLGTYYFRKLLDQLSENYVLAAVGYNAGPTRAKRWKKRHSCRPPAVWVELIPFTQTRQYVKNVLSYTLVYDSILKGYKAVDPMRLQPMQKEGC